eukprot:CAMPEP_0113471368 /NCGR_PEP_ID=MMETSP0014_2-20120614/16939_1 /TAXON_ID=2857 /ORGANISM="Nitzschia sp." /LENGTH=585 /DNA_ID=CAMNT_0000363995 /DNA_START=116 /DNA_END=1873 /DNA_ORIENTATION=- /assembly_acc=CAM_ASM_000159
MSNSSNSVDSDDGELAVLEPCGQCGKMVPSQNMMIHQLTACSSNRSSSSSSSRSATTNTRTTGTTVTATSVDTAVDLTEDDDDDDNDDHDDDTDSNDSNPKRRISGGPNNNTSNNNMDMDMDTVEVVDLVDSPPRSRRKTSATSAAGGSSSSAVAAAATTTTTDLTLDDSDDDDDNETKNTNPNEWACPKCTLLNSLEQTCCEACNYNNPNYVRPPDSTRTEQLVVGGGFGTTTTTSTSTFGGYQQQRQQQAQYPDPSSSPMTLSASAGAGALLGGLIGAAGNYVQGRSLTDGLVDGAMTGAIGGAIFHNATSSPGEDEQQNRQRRRQQQQQPSQRNTMNTVTHTSNSTSTASGSRYPHHRGSVADARASSAMGMAAYPSTNTSSSSSSSRSSRQQPRNSYRSVQTINPDGSVTTTTTGGGRSTRSTSMTSGNFQDPMVQLLLHQQLAESTGLMGSGRRGSSIRFGVGPTGFGPFMGGIAAAGAGANIDGMSYEQLLARFGDGSENRGADDSSINRLPVKKLEDPQKELPEDARQCMICLEDFEKGETRMTLPCLHGFHSQCCTKWLRQNGTCPICKSNVDMSDA